MQVLDDYVKASGRDEKPGYFLGSRSVAMFLLSVIFQHALSLAHALDGMHCSVVVFVMTNGLRIADSLCN